MAKIQNIDNPKAEEDDRGVDMKTGKAVWKKLSILYQKNATKLNIILSYDPARVLLDIHASELKTYVHTKIYTWLFRAALFIIAKNLKQPRRLSIYEKMVDKQWYIHPTAYYSVLKSSELSSHDER